MENSIYEFPAIFRRVHMEEPHEIADEVRFLREVWKRHLRGRVRRVLDVAAGNSPHGQILARDGIAVVGVDRSATMIAAGRAQARGLRNLRFYRRPIERFRIPERAFDAAFFSSETFPVMTENDAIISHLQSVGRVLRRGGLYCIDVDRMDGVREIRMRQLWEQRTIAVDGAVVKVHALSRPTPWHSGVYSIFDLRCEIQADGRTVRTRDLIPVRYTIPPTLELLARASGMFTMIAAYSDYSFDAPMAKCDRRWLGVLRRN